jgi:hypothetical protein
MNLLETSYLLKYNYEVLCTDYLNITVLFMLFEIELDCIFKNIFIINFCFVPFILFNFDRRNIHWLNGISGIRIKNN